MADVIVMSRMWNDIYCEPDLGKSTLGAFTIQGAKRRLSLVRNSFGNGEVATENMAMATRITSDQWAWFRSVYRASPMLARGFIRLGKTKADLDAFARDMGPADTGDLRLPGDPEQSREQQREAPMIAGDIGRRVEEITRKTKPGADRHAGFGADPEALFNA